MRLTGLDAARFFAFAGMVLVNFRVAAGVEYDASLTSQLISLLEGRAAALFVVLAGIGFVLASFNATTILKRAGFLFVIGLLNQTIFEADILHFYAIYFVLALPFANWKPRSLILLFGLTLLVSFLALITLDYERNWDWDALSYNDFWTLPGFIRHSFFNGWHPVLPWICFFFAGMVLGRLNLHDRSIQIRLVIWGAVVAGLSTLASRWLSGVDPELAEIAGTVPIPPGPLYVSAATGSAVCFIGLLLIGATRFAPTVFFGWLTAAGRMSLTLYIAHILLGMGLLQALGLLDGSLSNNQIFSIAIAFCVFAALFAKLWFAKSRLGPLETLMRRLTKD